MKEKGFLKRLMSKAGTGLLFVAACFAAIFILVEFHSNYVLVGVVALMLLISAYLFLNALFEEKSKEWSKSGDEDDPRKSVGEDESESGLRTIKYMKEMVSELKKQNELLENLENEIYMLSEKQVTQTKAVIKYNKENARQIAVSERENITLAMQDLKKALTGGVNIVAPQEEIPDLEDITFVEEEVPEMPEIPDLPPMEDIAFMEEEEPELPPFEDITIMEEEPELPPIEDIMLDELVLDEPIEEIIPAEPAPIEEPAIIEEPAPVEEPAPAAPVLSSDPNAMMTPDDIAKLIASMGQ